MINLVDICGDQLGQVAKAYGNVIASVGNISGVVVYNYNNGGEVGKLTAFNTAEGLIRNVLHTLWLDADGTLYIGPEASGFNTLVGGTFGKLRFPTSRLRVMRDGCNIIRSAGIPKPKSRCDPSSTPPQSARLRIQDAPARE